MSNTVILAEKPSQAKAYTEAFANVEKKTVITMFQITNCQTQPLLTVTDI